MQNQHRAERGFFKCYRFGSILILDATELFAEKMRKILNSEPNEE